MKNQKAQGISIRMLIVIALAVFVIFLVLTFVTGGWKYFSTTFKSVTEHPPEEVAAVKCQEACARYVNAGCPASGAFYDLVYVARRDVDFDGDGELTAADEYSCVGVVKPMLSKAQCACV